MDVKDVFLFYELAHEFLSFFGSQVCRDDGDLWVVAVTLPVHANGFESGVGKCCGKSGVATAYFDGTCSFTWFPDVDSEPDESAAAFDVHVWFHCCIFCLGALFVLSMWWRCPPEILECWGAGPRVAVVRFGFGWFEF